jgi:hypothetical protein
LRWVDNTGQLAGIPGASPGSEQSLTLAGSNTTSNLPLAAGPATQGNNGIGFNGTGFGVTNCASALWASARASTPALGLPNVSALIVSLINSGQIIVVAP